MKANITILNTTNKYANVRYENVNIDIAYEGNKDCIAFMQNHIRVFIRFSTTDRVTIELV